MYLNKKNHELKNKFKKQALFTWFWRVIWGQRGKPLIKKHYSHVTPELPSNYRNVERRVDIFPPF